MKKRIFLIAICILLAASFVGAACAEAADDTAPTSGTCGENLTWVLEDGTLTISGTGEMENYSSYSSAPWADKKDTIQAVIVNSGVTTIGSFAFYELNNLTSISLPNGLMSIGRLAMYDCDALVSIDIPDTVTSIGASAFNGARRLASVQLPSGISSIPSYCFYDCAFTEISIPEGVTKICDCAFQSNSSLQSVYMPSTIDTIEDMAFEYCSSLTDVYYNSTKADWQAINIGVNNSELRKAVWHCTDGDSGSCGENLIWELVDGTLTISGTGEMENYTYSSPAPWADKKDTIQTVIINSGVTTIGSSAFSGCKNLADISLPNGLMSIGSNAMYDCDALVSIDIPNTVTSIESYAFSYCNNLENITLSASLTSIGAKAFYFSYSLSSVIIPDSVTSIGDSAFDSASRLASVHLPSGISSIPSRCFSGCALTEISIPEGVTIICDGAFGYNSNLQSVCLPSTIETIENMAFGYCSSLTDVYYNSTQAEGQAIDIGANNSELRKAIWHCTDGDSRGMYPSSGTCGENLTWVLADNTLTISGTGAMYNYDRVYAYWPWEGKCDQIQTVVINSGVTTIGSYAFYELNNLTSVSLPEGLTSIGMGAYALCKALTEITIPEGVTSIGEHVFTQNSSLQSVSLPATIETIASYAFNECNSLSDVFYAGTRAEAEALEIGLGNAQLIAKTWHCSDGELQGIGPTSGTCGENLTWELVDDTLTISGFGSMDNFDNISYAPWQMRAGIIRTIVVNSGVTTIGDYAFQNCANLTSISLPDELTTIGKSAMFNCGALVSIDIPDSVTEIGANAFELCEKLENIMLPASLMIIGSNAFHSCEKLENILLPVSLTTIGNAAFSGCDELTSIVIPDSVTSIGSQAFSYDVKLSSVQLSSGLVTIPDWCFVHSALTEITIPEGVMSIGNQAFWHNSSLQSVSLPSTIETIDQFAFSECYNITDVYYPGTQEEAEAITIGIRNDELSAATWHYSYVPEKPMTTLELPRDLVVIEEEAFAGAGEEKIVIPATVTTIEARAFADSAQLKVLYFEGSPETIADDILSGCQGVTISVAEGSTAEAWASEHGFTIEYHE